MMSKPDSEMDGTICKQCNRPINDHLPEELEECTRKIEFKNLKDDDMRSRHIKSSYSHVNINREIFDES